MSLGILTGRGKRRGMTSAEKDAEIDRLNALADALNTENVQLICASARSGITIAAQATELELAAKVLKHWAAKVVRAEAEHRRLRAAVIAARPRITEVPSAMVRPYAVGIPVPYPVPLQPRDTVSEITQELAILDQPDPRPAGWASLVAQPA
jgi:hypothetical protein